MLAPTLLRQAARENALWCDLVCRAHAAPGALHAAYWIARGPVPPLYPRFVTLGGPERADEQVAALQALLAACPGEALAVKDSFGTLDLAPLGLELLFDAEWIALEPGPAAPVDARPIRWTAVRDGPALEAWEDAWRGAAPPVELAGRRLFPPALLRERDVVFLAGAREGRVVATGVLHRTAEVVGLSNVTGDAPAAFPACAAAARAWCPGLPVVGYERGPELEAARAAGFTSRGPLAVWQRRGTAR